MLQQLKKLLIIVDKYEICWSLIFVYMFIYILYKLWKKYENTTFWTLIWIALNIFGLGKKVNWTWNNWNNKIHLLATV